MALLSGDMTFGRQWLSIDNAGDYYYLVFHNGHKVGRIIYDKDMGRRIGEGWQLEGLNRVISQRHWREDIDVQSYVTDALGRKWLGNNMV